MKLFFCIVLTVIFVSAPSAHGQVVAAPEYLRFYTAGQYAKAVDLLKKVVEKEPADALAWNYLGLSLTALKKDKDSIKAYEKAVKLKPEDAVLRGNLAYAYYLRNDRRAVVEALETVRLDPKITAGHLVLAAFYVVEESYGAAYDHANKVIALDQKLAEAYLFKAQSLLGNHFLQTRSIKQSEYKRASAFKEAAEAFAKYVDLKRSHPDVATIQVELEALKSIADHYARTDAENTNKTEKAITDTSGNSPFKILKKPQARYSNEGRDKGVNGTVRILVQLRADGKIGHMVIVKPLGYGMDQQALAAARAIQFIPAKKHGTPESVYVTIEYNFYIF
jgi:TonB family protein